MKMDQIAFACFSAEAAERVKASFGLQDKEWIKDRVEGIGTHRNIAELQFNYDLGIELEILRYVKGPSWLTASPILSGHLPFISHVGVHLDDGEEFPEMKGCPLVQETFTLSHTADYLTRPGSPGFGRKYHYRIHEIGPGSYIKYIRRIHPKAEGGK